MPRRTKLTRELIDKIAGHIEGGNYAVVACKLAGVSERTYYHWLKLGKERGTSIYSELYDAIENAEAEREARLVDVLVQSKTVNASKWTLERTAPERWDKKEGTARGQLKYKRTGQARSDWMIQASSHQDSAPRSRSFAA